MLDDELGFRDLGDGGDRDDAPYLGRRDPSEYPDEGETPEDHEDWEEGERPDDGEHDDDGEHPTFEEEMKEEAEEDWQKEQSQYFSGPMDGRNSIGAASPAAAVVAIVAAVFIFSPGASGISAEADYLNPHGNSLDYGVHVSMEYHPKEDDSVIDWNDTDTGLVLIAKNAKESVSIPLITSNEGTEVSVTTFSEGKDSEEVVYQLDLHFTGTMEGLTENHPYSVGVLGYDGNQTKTYFTKNLNTSEKQTEIRGFYGECTCLKDGNYRFRLDFTDENGYYSNFTYKLMSPDGETVKSSPLDVPTGKMIIPDVDKLDGKDYVLVISFESDDPHDAQAAAVTDDLDGGMRILRDHGRITITQEITL